MRLKHLLFIPLILLIAFSVHSGEQTINDLTALGETPATGDYLVVWDTSASSSVKVLFSNLMNYGIADDSTVQIDDADAAENDYTRLTANGLEGRSYAEVLSDIGAAGEDGDVLDIDYTPSYYTPATTPPEASDVNDLAAHLYGIDQALTTLSGGAVDTSGTPEASDVAVFTDANTIEGKNESEFKTLFNMEAGTDYAAIDHDANHIDGGSDVMDGDKLEITWTPSNYTPATTPAEVDAADQLTAHLYGIDDALSASGGGCYDGENIFADHEDGTEFSRDSTSYGDMVSYYVYIPSSNPGKIYLKARIKSNSAYTASVRLEVGGEVSDAVTSTATSYAWKSEVSVDVSGLASGWTALNIEGKTASAGGICYVQGYSIRWGS